MNTKKFATLLVALSGLILCTAAKGPCASKRSCSDPAVKKGGCHVTHTTTYIIRRNKNRGRVIPPVPGHYHVHFERGDIFQRSNQFERVSYPYPTRTR